MKYLQIVCIINYFILNLNCFWKKFYENITLFDYNSSFRINTCNNCINMRISKY